MSAYVYLLSEHGEHGAENVEATRERSKVSAMVAKKAAGYSEENRVEAEKRIAEHLAKPDEQLVGPCGHSLMSGWGGLMFHVVELA